MAGALVRSRGLEGRVRIFGAREEILGGYEAALDLVTQFLVLYEIPPPLKREVLARCAAALKPGGVLLLSDEAYPEDEATARDPIRGFSVVAQWFELTWGNLMNTRSEIRGLLAGAGLALGEEAELSRFRIVTAVKPG